MHGQELWKLVDDASPAPSLAVSGFAATVTAGVVTFLNAGAGGAVVFV